MRHIDQMTIVGTGLLGTSLALAVRARGLAGRVVGLGRRQATLDQAKAMGGFDAVTTDPAEALAGAGLVVVAVPLSGFEAVLREIAPHQQAGMAITDVGSTKASVQAAATRHLPWPGRFVGAHPMAGSEQSGPEAAMADLFDARPCVLCAGPDAEPDALAQVRDLWQGVGMRLIELAPDTHDRYAATVSHVPHLAAGLLVALARERGGWPLASTGFRDATRLAAADPALWRDILVNNQNHVRDALHTLRHQLDELIERLDAPDEGQALRAWLEEQKTARDQWYHDNFP